MVSNRWHWIAQRLVLEAGFRCVYPLLARLPAALGLALAAHWGRWMGRLDCDWRSVSLRQHFVAQQTAAAFRELCPEETAAQIERRVRERFAGASQEELEGHWLARGLKSDLPVNITGLETLYAASQNGRGLVLLTFHFAAAIWGIACLGRAGLRVSPMSSHIVEDRRVPACIRTYFRAKYAGLTHDLNGGAVIHVEEHPAAFYRRLKAGEAIVVLADAPARARDNAFTANFIGKRRAFAAGALRMARKTGALVAAFVCLRDKTGYRLEISPPRGQDGDYEAACSAAINFLEEKLRQRPSDWWAADLLPNFPCDENPT